MRARLICVLALAIAAATAGGVTAEPSQAKSPIYEYTANPSTTQAGGHPDLVTRFEIGTPQTSYLLEGVNPDDDLCNCAAAKNIIAQLPAGVIGNPHSTPRCSFADFADRACPVDSQVGVVVIHLATEAVNDGGGFVAALFNMVPSPDQAGLLAFPTPVFGTKPIFIEITARTEGDYGLEVKTVGIPRIIPLNGFTAINWGIPADDSHDTLRFPFGCCTHNLGERNAVADCRVDPRPFVVKGTLPPGACFEEAQMPGVPSNSPETPFMSGPTTCGAPLAASLEVAAYDLEFDYAETPYPATTGCSRLSFDPSQSIKPTTPAADSPSGAEFVLTVPQFQNPTVPSPSELRSAVITLPEGFTIAPNLTNGKTTCSDAEARFATRLPAQCPEESKVGTISVETPVLPGPLHGATYLGEPKPGDRYRMILVFDGFGLHIKLPGSVKLNRSTGQITIEFNDLPQAPFETFTSHIFGAERGPLATPTRCGTYEVKSVFTPWAGELPQQTSRQFFTIDSGPNGSPCPGPVHDFNPGFSAGSADNTAGVHTPFSLDFTRGDGDQNLAGVALNTPPGFTASLRGIPYCSEPAISLLGDSGYTGFAEIASPACTSASQVGTARAGIGAGTHPLYQDGKVYLAGPYRGAPLSFLIVFPAVSGPYDLGNIAVRAAAYVDPVTAQVATVSDPLPQLIDGIPLRSRQIRIELDRDRFTRNPTNCDRFAVRASLTGDEGTVADRSSHFQVANCADLPYSPNLKLRLTGGVKRRGHPAIHADFLAESGEANSRFVSVLLPKGQLLDNSHIGTVCTRVAFAKRSCPAASRIGRAEAVTPLLDQPLRGTAYLRSSSHELPDIAIDLQGQVDFELVGRVDSVNARLRTTFETVPDIPVSRFSLDLAGGRKGLLQNTDDLCGRNMKATVRMKGQNGRRALRSAPLNPACGDRKGRGR